MRKILLIGNSPLPNENVKVRPAAGLRTWQFLRGLGGANGGASASVGGGGGKNLSVEDTNVGDRFEIKLVTIAMPECYGENGVAQKNEKIDDFLSFENYDRNGLFEPKNEAKSLPGQARAQTNLHIQISKDDPNLLKKLQKIHDEFQPEIIVAVNTYPSFIASRLNSSAIFWADLNGWIMAEAQAQAHKMASNDYLLHYTEMEESILRRADKFSVVSEAQKFAVLGELASVGRLCAESFGYEFCEVVSNGMEWFEGEKGAIEMADETCSAINAGDAGLGENGTRLNKNFQIEKSNLVKSNLQNAHVSTRISENGQGVKSSEESESVPKNAFVVLWMGGYNTWVDEVTLFKGVEAAMQSCENLYFVSTGGEITGLDNKTFANFRKMIDESGFKNRFVFLGWVDSKLIPRVYASANVGLNVDRLCVETLTGARNRINEMMKFGLPVITTLGSEISYEVMRVGAGIGVASGKSELLSEAIVRMWKEAEGCEGASGDNFASYGKNGRQYVEKFCNYKVTLKPLLKWLEHPIAAPDKGVITSRGGFLPIGAMRSGIKYLRENGVGKFSKKLWQRIKM